ncbi:allophanate hydrolase subunit 1 [Nocardioides sp. NPDC092400]|uniref:5-oxoprolinase subunit B family protein n=1 Tax=Nocardioides sp. NPDC092400 TaxID=3155196 RepID=UPI003418C7D9
MAAGLEAVLVEVDSTDQMLALYRGLERARRDGVARGLVNLVPASKTVLVEFDTFATSRYEVEQLVSGMALSTTSNEAGDVLLIEATYDGVDLRFVCETLGLARDEFVRWHSSLDWKVAFTGFAPGFGYMVAAEHRTTLPRLAQPRERVPAGSIAMAGNFTGIYPQSSPGGWRIIGRTQHRLFDVAAAPPTQMLPGRIVRFAVTK